MKKIWLYFIMILCINANDGAYTLSGNQLIPIYESNISIKKEILKITLLKDGILDVKVEYTFFNPTKKKTIVVGFEASEPVGDVTTESVNGGHPYMKSFSVIMNGKSIPFKANSNILKKDIGYVYYFNALFKKGMNTVIHHYTFQHSAGAAVSYTIDYILSAASRWKGEVIEDFTLIIDVGDYSEFQIVKSFFTKADEWQVDGVTKDCLSDYYNSKSAIQFYVRKAPIIFKKKNFKINGELYLVSEQYSKNNPFYVENFDYKKVKLWFSGMIIKDIFPKDRISFKIYKNFPYAQNGYIFNDPVIQKYYESLPWYKKNPNYKSPKPIIDERLNTIALSILKNLPYAKRGYVFKTHDLDSFFTAQSWYVKKNEYKLKFSDLSKDEKAWIDKIKNMKKSDNIDFYLLLDEYEKIRNMNVARNSSH